MQLRTFCLPVYYLKIKTYKIIILPLVLHRCETLSLKLKEEHRWRVFENRMLRRIFGLKRDEVTGGWIKLRNEKLLNLYSSPDIIGVIKWTGHVTRKEEMRNAYKILVGKPAAKILLGRFRCRLDDNIQMDIREVGCEGVDWIHLAQNRDRWRALVNTVMNLH
jgi:hypothetical protein